MGCAKKVIPWAIDPIGMAVQKLTGFDYTPGGILNKVINPPKPKISQPKYTPPPPRPTYSAPSFNMPEPPSYQMPTPPPPRAPPPPPEPWRPAQAPEPEAKWQHEGTGAGASADRTRGLVGGSKKKGERSASLLA